MHERMLPHLRRVRDGSYTMMGVFFLQHRFDQVERTSRKERVSFV